MKTTYINIEYAGGNGNHNVSVFQSFSKATCVFKVNHMYHHWLLKYAQKCLPPFFSGYLSVHYVSIMKVKGGVCWTFAGSVIFGFMFAFVVVWARK